MAAHFAGFSRHFGIENLPFGVATVNDDVQAQCVSRYENSVILLDKLLSHFDRLSLPDGVFRGPSLNKFAALGRTTHQDVRRVLQSLIERQNIPQEAIVDVNRLTMHLPVSIGDFTDFSCSSHHNKRISAALVGTSGNLPPGYLHMPLGYAGRCSSIVVSGTPVTRPRGQYFTHGLLGLKGERPSVSYGPTRWMDYEMELGVVIGKPLPHGLHVDAQRAAEHVFGYVLVNDWSARDIQQLEMIPVGPLNSKHSATSLSPWIITPDALAPFTVPMRKRETELAPYLDQHDCKLLDIDMQIGVSTEAGKFRILGRTSANVMDWSFEQLIAHQSSAGCGLRTGDLLAIGTISGPERHEHGCLSEHAPGDTPASGYIKDGEEIQIVGFCGDGVGFGDCKGSLLPALDRSIWSER